LDDIDRKLISELQIYGRTTFSKLGKLVGYSSMGVKKRLKKIQKQLKIIKKEKLKHFTF